MKKIITFLFLFIILFGCRVEDPFFSEEGFEAIALNSSLTGVQPMTGLVMWPTHSQRLKYAPSISLEFQYCLPCRVVTGKVDGKIQYDWSYLETILNDIQSRNHQAIIRFRY